MKVNADILFTRPLYFRALSATWEVIPFIHGIRRELKPNQQMPALMRRWAVEELKRCGYLVEQSPIVLESPNSEPVFAAWPVIRARKEDVQILVDIRDVSGEEDSELQKIALWCLEHSPQDQIYLAFNLACSPLKTKTYFRKGFLGPEAGDACELQVENAMPMLSLLHGKLPAE